jgi:arylsulfatase A-like enzyme
LEHHNTHLETQGDGRYVRVPPCLPDTPRTRADFADYVVAAGRLDVAMGRVLSAVEDAGLSGNTVVLVTTDHGIAFPGMKCNLTDHGTGVMMMLRGPGLERYEGKVVEPMVTHLDVLPTLRDLMGVHMHDRLDGRSMLPVISGEADALHDAVYGMVNFHAAYEPMRTVRTTRYRYIRRWETGTATRVLPNCDDSLSKRELMEHGWAHRPPAAEELFDLMLDPNEARNVAGEESYASVLADLRQRLTGWMEANEDPLRAGHLSPPRGLVLNPVTQVSPSMEPSPAIP